MIVMARKNGRLGNRLALAAHLAAFAMERGVRVINPTLDEYADSFEGWNRDLWGRFPSRRSLLPALPTLRHGFYLTIKALAYALRRFWPRGPFHEVVDIGIDREFDLSDPDFVSRARRKIVFTIGWLFRDKVAMEKQRESLRSLFKPREEHLRAVQRALSNARAHADVVVGVHIRHGDYRAFLGGRYYYSLEQYRSFMAQMCDLLAGRRVAFLVCSDAIHPLEAFEGLAVYRGPGHVVEDMYALGACDYIIGPPSTFSYWASFIGRRPLLHIESVDLVLTLDDFIVSGLTDCYGEERA